MTTSDDREKNERILKKLVNLFVEAPDSTDQEETDAEFETNDVDIVRLGIKISKIVQAASEKDRLAWLEEYRKEKEKGTSRPDRLKSDPPKTRTEKLRLLESLQGNFTHKGVPIAVGFKKLEELSDEDLSRIIAILQEEDEEPPRP